MSTALSPLFRPSTPTGSGSSTRPCATATIAGASMNLSEKLEVARVLASLGVDIIEAGFPIASVGDFEAVRAIAGEITGSTVCGLARCNDKDIDRAWEAVKYAQRSRIHVFLATSAIHREHKLRMTPAQIIERAVASVRRARSYCPDIEFSPEDAARTELDFLCEVVAAAIEAGATTVNIPDTVGYATPTQYAAVIRTLRERVGNIGQAIISTHCHDDLGMAVANSLAGVEAGARQVECTINGIGERAGNAALEEIVMALKTRHDYFGLTTGIKTERSIPPAGWSRRSPACSCSGTRRSSAATHSPTRREFTRTACSRSDRPTRSCGPRTWEYREPISSWASTPAGTRCATE